MPTRQWFDSTALPWLLRDEVRDTLGKMRQNLFSWPKILKFGVLVGPTAPWKI
jgi:hypothetical protein